MRTLYHLHINASKTDHYYGSLAALVGNHSHTVLGIGIDSLYRVDWSKPYVNENITIKKGTLYTTASLKKPTKKKK